MRTLLTLRLRDGDDVLHVRERCRHLGKLLKLSEYRQARFASAASELARMALQRAGRRLVVRADPTREVLELHCAQLELDEWARHVAGSAASVASGEVFLGEDAVCLRVPTPLAGVDLGRLAFYLAGKRPRLVAGADRDAQARELQRALDARYRREMELLETNQKLDEANRALAEHTQELNAAIRDLETFNSATSHDLKQPLYVIDLHCQTLRAIAADDRVATSVDEITKAVARMQDMLNGLQELARVRAERGTPCDPVEAATTALANLDAQRRQAGAVVRVGDLPVCDVARVHLVQLFQNLVSNSIKYRRDVPPEIAIGGRREGDRVVYWVEDNGQGIAPEHQEAVFRPFHRVDSGGEGAGIGLGLVATIASRYGGEVELESTPGEGTRIEIAFPDNRSEPG